MGKLSTEGKKVAFFKDGKSTEINIVHERRIGRGLYGDIYEADVLIGKRHRKYVIKKFIDDEPIASANATQAVTNYQMAKEAGLKVFTTYRLSEDGRSILMTNGNNASTICLGTDEYSCLFYRGKPNIEEFEDDNFEKLIEGVFGQSIIAANRDISLHFDAFFYLVNIGLHSIDYVIGDLDHVNRRQIPPDQSRLINNLGYASRSLEYFVQHNFETPVKYLKRINNLFMKNMEYSTKRQDLQF